MITYVNTVLVSNLATGAVFAPAAGNNYRPAPATSMSAVSTDAGKFIFMNCDPDIASNKLYDVDATSAKTINTLRVGIITKKNNAVHLPNGNVEYQPIIKWSNEIKANDIKSYNNLTYAADTEDTVYIDFSDLQTATLDKFALGGKRIIVRLTYKDMPHRYRKWTESYEYVTNVGDTKATIAANIAKMINKEWKRARVSAIVGTINTTAASGTAIDGTNYFHADANWGTSTATTGTVLQLVALPYDDDDANDTINWANKVRFNANIYWTDPAEDGWESLNKNFPKGVEITKVPGKQYPASAKLVRDHESKAQGYLGILNRGEGTWPIIKPEIEANINAHYDGITLEFENMYRAADDIFRKTKQTVEIYGLTGQLASIKAILDAFVDLQIQD